MISTVVLDNPNFVKSATFDNDKLTIIMKSLDVIKQPGLIGSLSVNLTSRNYNVIPMVFNLMAQGEHLDVTMDSWTYGEDASGPEAVLPEGVTSLTITYAKADGTLLNEKPSDAGEYIVTVSCSKDGVIYSGTASFEIEPAPITADMVALEQNQLTFLPNADYSSGVEQTQGVTVTWKGQPAGGRQLYPHRQHRHRRRDLHPDGGGHGQLHRHGGEDLDGGPAACGL